MDSFTEIFDENLCLDFAVAAAVWAEFCGEEGALLGFVVELLITFLCLMVARPIVGAPEVGLGLFCDRLIVVLAAGAFAGEAGLGDDARQDERDLAFPEGVVDALDVRGLEVGLRIWGRDRIGVPFAQPPVMGQVAAVELQNADALEAPAHAIPVRPHGAGDVDGAILGRVRGEPAKVTPLVELAQDPGGLFGAFGGGVRALRQVAQLAVLAEGADLDKLAVCGLGEHPPQPLPP